MNYRKKINCLLTLSVAFFFTTFTSCKKDVENQITSTSQSNLLSSMQLETKVNPYSITNITQALAALGRNDVLDENRKYLYYKFSPEKVTGEMLAIIEKDENHKILDFPFADGNMYSEQNSNMTEDEISMFEDGKLYIVFNATSEINDIFEDGSEIDAEKLDELYLPAPEDENLQIQALISAGYTKEPTVEEFKIKLPCLLKRPSGRVTYLDQFDNSTIGVPQIQVWALLFGIPLTTHTDDNGYYSIPWRFSAGTFIGTHATNFKANIKPMNTTGGFLANVVQIAKDFIVGSVHIDGWYTSCDMKNSIDIKFTKHNQPRYWAQLLHAIKLHHDYTSQDGISHAPNLLAIYAQWDENSGSASTPMLGHIQFNPISQLTNLAGVLFGTNLAITAPNLFNLFTGLLPDVTFKESSTEEPHFSEHLMNYAFHEFGHASLFQQVGQTYWNGIITNIIAATQSTCSGYGCGNEIFSGLTQVNESWAEFIAKEHHRRIHPAGKCWVKPFWGYSTWLSYPSSQEDVPYFFNDWLNTGIFYDLIDPINLINEPNDKLQGYSISNMYNCFTPATDGFCDWRATFIQHNPSVNQNDLDNLMKKQNGWNGICTKGWIGGHP